MNQDLLSGRRSATPTSSGRSSPVPRAERRAVEDELYKADKGLRRYGALVERALASWDTAPQEWADYIAFLSRLLKASDSKIAVQSIIADATQAIQSRPKDAPVVPHTEAVASRLAQCLNPALPSGVHKKAVEIYTYIFGIFGHHYLNGHLQDYLPGLAPVLAFASLTVRPTVYSLYEQHLLKLPTANLRPSLKALILAVLPALEDETAEDFDRAESILGTLEVKFANGVGNSGRDGIFWQTLFLCVVTSPSRRQGALNYLSRKLPKFVAQSRSDANAAHTQIGDAAELSEDLTVLITPEPGLLIRCFVSGLSDINTLVQRGFLDILVTHLPLHSPVLTQAIDEKDLDLLMSAAVGILLRRDMSLNRRLWSWLLGPELENRNTTRDAASPSLEGTPAERPESSHQLRYFVAYARLSLKRSILAMLSSESAHPATKARPFRICLSLMDRWEIGGSILPEIFLPALRSLHEYSKSASANAQTEVMRSANNFFDGVESGLIWSTIVKVLHDAVCPEGISVNHLQLVDWIVSNFNVREDDMTSIHAPLATLYLLSRLRRLDVATYRAGGSTALATANKLAHVMSKGALQEKDDRKKAESTAAVGIDDADRVISEFYQHTQNARASTANPFERRVIGQTLLHHTAMLALHALQSRSTQRFQASVQLLLVLPVTHTLWYDSATEEFFSGMREVLAKAITNREMLALPILSSIILLLAALKDVDTVRQCYLEEIALALGSQLWEHLSPEMTKYHVETVRLLWQLEGPPFCEQAFEASLLEFMHPSKHDTMTNGRIYESREVAVRRFTVLWNHTVPPLKGPASAGSTRRGSAVPSVADAAHLPRRLQILSPPLFRALDALRESSTPAFQAVHKWLGSLPSLDRVFLALAERLSSVFERVNRKAPLDEEHEREDHEARRDLQYALSLFNDVLCCGTDWTWQCFSDLETYHQESEDLAGPFRLASDALQMLCSQQNSGMQSNSIVIALLRTLIISPAAKHIRRLHMDEALLDRMMACLQAEDVELQGALLPLITLAIQLRVGDEESGRLLAEPGEPSGAGNRTLVALSKASGNGEAPLESHLPPPQLLRCLCTAFASRSARPHLEQWLGFLSTMLPIFANALFANLIPLVDALCAQIAGVFEELVAITRGEPSKPSFCPDATVLCLLEALEITLARAHECLEAENMPDESLKSPTQSASFFGSVASGVFRVDGPPSKTAGANNRLTVTLAFQDAVRSCMPIWSWSGQHSEADGYDSASAATTAYVALRLRNKTRYLLEQMFAVEPLECLEVVIHHWRFEPQPKRAVTDIALLQVLQGSRPKHMFPALLDSICSRANPVVVSVGRQSSQTVELSAIDVALFLLAYLRSTEDDAMDEVWTDCLAFLKDVLANPLPYRQIMPALLDLVHLLAQKVGNTNFGEQKRMRRELADVFQRLLAAAFTSMPYGSVVESNGTRTPDDVSGTSRDAGSMTLLAVLKRAVEDFDVIIDAPDRVAMTVGSISNNTIAPAFHAKSFPSNVTSEHLSLLLVLAKKAPTSKAWKKEVTDVFNDPRLFLTPPDLLERYWLPVLHQWTLRDKDRIPELLSRLTPPSSAGIMFGVGANAARLEADRRTQLSLRRISLLLVAAPEDTWLVHLRDFDEKLLELFAATNSSSPSAAIKADLFMFCRALVLSISPVHLSPLWPAINEGLQNALNSLMQHDQRSFTNLGLLQACKLLDQLVAISPDEFQLHEWLYIVDTVDAVYQPSDQNAFALSDQISEAFATRHNDEEDQTMPSHQPRKAMDHSYRLLFDDDAVDKGDVRAMDRDEFVRRVLRPALSQLSIHSYEGVYNMERVDLGNCRRSLLRDLLDIGTIVE